MRERRALTRTEIGLPAGDKDWLVYSRDIVALAFKPLPIFVAAPGLIRLGDRQRAPVAGLDDIVRADDRSPGIRFWRWPEPLRLKPSEHLIDLIPRRRRLAGTRLQFLRIGSVYVEIGVMRRDQVGKVDDLMAYVERSGRIIDLGRISRDLSRYSLTARAISKSPVFLAWRSARSSKPGRRCAGLASNSSSKILPGLFTGIVEDLANAGPKAIASRHIPRRHCRIIGSRLVRGCVVDSTLDRAPQLSKARISWRLPRRSKLLAHCRRDPRAQGRHLIERRERRQILRRVEDRRLLAAHRPRRTRDRLRNLTGSVSHRICRER